MLGAIVLAASMPVLLEGPRERQRPTRKCR